MDIQKEREAFEIAYSEIFSPIIKRPYPVLENGDYKYIEIDQAWKLWQAKSQAVPEKTCSIQGHEIIINETKNELINDYDIAKEDEYLLEALVYRGVCIGKSQAVPEGRTDIQIIEQTIGIVRLIGESNSFECANSKVFPFESKSPRLQVWWRVACEIQELLTDTDPNNCDFEEYKAMVEAQEQSHDSQNS